MSTTTGHTDPPVTGSVMLHLYPDVPVRVTQHPDEDRVVVAIGTGTLTLHLFCDCAELLALRDALTAAVTDLDTARHGVDDSRDTADTTRSSTDDAGSSASDEVRSPAA